jgi:hypothetical protein
MRVSAPLSDIARGSVMWEDPFDYGQGPEFSRHYAREIWRKRRDGESSAEYQLRLDQDDLSSYWDGKYYKNTQQVEKVLSSADKYKNHPDAVTDYFGQVWLSYKHRKRTSNLLVYQPPFSRVTPRCAVCRRTLNPFYEYGRFWARYGEIDRKSLRLCLHDERPLGELCIKCYNKNRPLNRTLEEIQKTNTVINKIKKEMKNAQDNH